MTAGTLMLGRLQFLSVVQKKNGFDQKSLKFIFFSEKSPRVAQAGPEFVTFLSASGRLGLQSYATMPE